ncbi:sugar lactone lactonase YvrE [Rhizobium sp. BK602]|nr:sugar lactone lactonase YvrE [Rhizobium sp. BK602]
MDPEPDAIGHRKNDGRVDWAGNFWIGTLREADYAPVGAIYRVDPELGVERIRGDLAIPNGLAFDEILGRAYYADTRAYAIWVRDYDAANSTLGDERLFARTQAPARPDGSCLDSEGHIWNAEYAGGRLVRFAPDGQISQEINLPFTYPTCCCFGGKDFDKLFVTSASEPLSAEECSHQPLAGHTLVLDVGVRGRPEWRTSI